MVPRVPETNWQTASNKTMFVREVLALTGEWDSFFYICTIRGALGKFSINIDIGYTDPHFRHSDTLTKDYDRENKATPISRKSVPLCIYISNILLVTHGILLRTHM